MRDACAVDQSTGPRLQRRMSERRRRASQQKDRLIRRHRGHADPLPRINRVRKVRARSIDQRAAAVVMAHALSCCGGRGERADEMIIEPQFAAHGVVAGSADGQCSGRNGGGVHTNLRPQGPVNQASDQLEIRRHTICPTRPLLQSVSGRRTATLVICTGPTAARLAAVRPQYAHRDEPFFQCRRRLAPENQCPSRAPKNGAG